MLADLGFELELLRIFSIFEKSIFLSIKLFGFNIFVRGNEEVFLALKQKIFGTGREASKDRARSRLHFVLVQDRSGLTGEQMTKFKQEMVAVIEKYFDVDKKSFDIAYKRDNDTTTLLINSPVIVKRLVSVKNNNNKKPTTEEQPSV